MLTIRTRQGRLIEILCQSELCDPVNMGEYVRAYCHIHGSDHQRSLSINTTNGWGHCFNAACNATVLVAEWSPAVAQRLIHLYFRGLSPGFSASYQPPQKRTPPVSQPMLLHPTKAPPQWQQDELVALLSVDEHMRAALAHSERARVYLNERGIPLEVAQMAGVCYLPPALLKRPELQMQRKALSRWTERILFPLNSPAGKGYIGRSLWHWQPGMDENTHKSLLDKPGKPRRWIKTNPAGWFGLDLDQLAGCLIIVEGAFDRLALLAAGFHPTEVVALVGTSLQVDWFPYQVKSVVLALDSDEGGLDATRRLAECLARAGLCVSLCPPLQDGWGKDWSERWRRIGYQSLRPIYEIYTELARPA